MTANNSKNTVSPVATALVAAMNEAVKGENRQNEMVKAIFSDTSATFTTSRLAAILREEGRDKSEAIDELMSDICDEVQNVLNAIELKTEEKKKATSQQRKDEIAYEIERLNNKRNAARLMMERAIKCVYHLRTIGATDVVITNKGRIKARQPDPDFKGKHVGVEYSGNELVRESQASVSKIKPESSKKKEEKKTSKVTIAEGMRSAFEASRKYLETLDKPIDDLAPELTSEADKLMRTLIVKYFADDKGKVDFASIKEYLEGKRTEEKPLTAKEAEELQKKTNKAA